MATPGQLTACVAACLGLPETRVRTYYKYLREAGLVSKGGRGLNGPRMTYQDAARLLIVAGGTRFDRDDAATIVASYADCRAAVALERGDAAEYSMAGAVTWCLEGFHLPLLQNLPEKHTFPIALVAIMEAAATGQMFCGLGDKKKDRSRVWVIVKFAGPVPNATIEIQVEGGGASRRQKIDYLPAGDKAIERGDLRMVRHFTDKTLFPVARLIADERESV